MSEQAAKDEYQQEAQSALDKIKAQIDELRVQADHAQAGARDRLGQGIETLRKRQAEAKAKLDDAQKAGADAWKSMAKQTEQVVGDLGDAFSKLADEVQSTVGAAGSAATKGRDAFLDEWKKMRAQRSKLLG
jgi:chromosome segregation ATPase